MGGASSTSRRHAAVVEAMELLPGPGGERFAKVLEHGSMEVEVYAPRGTDPQKPHTRDELYVVVAGTEISSTVPSAIPSDPATCCSYLPASSTALRTSRTISSCG